MESIKDWVAEIVVVDMESEDDTLEVAERYRAKIIQFPNMGWPEPGRQTGMDAATQPWLFVIDADERAGPGIADALEPYMRRKDVAAVMVPRKNYWFGRFSRYSGVWPDWQIRLLRKEMSRWPADYSHSGPVVDGPMEKVAATIENAIVHESYKSIHEWAAAANRYTDNEADRLAREGTKASLARLLFVPLWHFAWPYLRWQGFRSGRYGLGIALLASWYRILAELKLWERQSSPADEPRQQAD
jgi:glycosyltransferase involved in cell wall biosynthesis